MANKNLFVATTNTNSVANSVATTVNAAGGKAYEFTAKHALAQIAATNCFNGTYYADADANLQIAKDAVNKLRSDPEFIGKVAIYCRERGFMKDMPAYLTAVLAGLDAKVFRKVFDRVIDNGKMLRNFMQIGRSGQAGKKLNMTSGAVRNAIDNWFKNRKSETIFRASIGNDPSMRDMLRMARPRPETEEKAALYAYLKGATFDPKIGDYVTLNKDKSVKYRHSFESLPLIIRQFEQFKKSHDGEIPNVDFRMLDSVLNKEEAKALWARQARNGGWQLTRMNLNNFAKYGVFSDSELTSIVAKRLADPIEIKNAKAFPYQLQMAYKAISSDVPHVVREALQDAMEAAISNVPSFEGKTYVMVDTSGSMQSAITGTRVGATSNVTCVDVAALFAAATLRQNKDAQIIPFDTSVHLVDLNPRDTVMTNSKKLARGGGGTDCSCALRYLNQKGAKGNSVIFVSDNESWVDGGYRGRATGLMNEWAIFKKNNPKAKLICIDLTPRLNSQSTQHQDILQVGGFGDQVFDVIASFIKHGSSNDHWVDVIDAIDLDAPRKSYEEVKAE